MNPRVVVANLFVSTHERLPREVNNVLHACVPHNPDTCFRRTFMNQDNMSFDLCVQDLDQSEIFTAELVETLEFDGKFKIIKIDPAVNRCAVRQEQQGEPRPGYSQRLSKGPSLQRTVLNDPNASVTVTYLYDSSSIFVSMKIAYPELRVRRDKPENVRDASIHQIGYKHRSSPRSTGSSSSSSPASSPCR
jgi:hypothetical protein